MRGSSESKTVHQGSLRLQLGQRPLRERVLDALLSGGRDPLLLLVEEIITHCRRQLVQLPLLLFVELLLAILLLHVLKLLLPVIFEAHLRVVLIES